MPEVAWLPAGVGLALGGRSPRAAALGLGLAAGLHAQAVQLAEARAGAALARREAVLEGVVAARASALAPRWIDLEAVRGAGAARLRLFAAEPAALERFLPGDRLRAQARIAPLLGARNPGEPDRLRRHWRAGLGAGATLPHGSLAVALEAPGGALRGIHVLRRRVARELAAAGPGSALIRGLALGDRAELAAPTREAFNRLGLTHALSVSGLHLAFAAAASFAIARRALGRVAWLAARCDARRLALAPAALFALGYALLAGWEVPAQRSLVMLAAAAFGIARGRPQRPGPVLGGAALCILAGEPQALFDPGAQLSFAAVAGLVYVVRGPAAPRAAARAVAAALRQSAAAGAATAPILAWHGIGVPLVALLANLVALPWLGLLLLPAALVAALACALEIPGAPALARLAAALAVATEQALVCAASALPASARAAPSLVWILGLALLGVAVLRAQRTAVCGALALLQAGLSSVAPVASLLPAPPRLVVLEVGQGDASVVQGRSAALLVDAGGARGGFDAGSQRVVPALRALGARRIDLLIATHADLDHRGGIPAVLAALPVGELWLPWGTASDPHFAALLDAARAAGTPVREVGRGSPTRRLGDLRVEPLWPPRGGTGARNARSLVVRVTSGAGRRVLLPGDLDAAAEAELVALQGDLAADVLLLAHHGSRGSSSDAFLARVAPALAIASAPCRGRFEMPHAEVRERLAARGIPLAWTGRDGAVRVPLFGALAPLGTGRPQHCGT